MNKYIIIKLSEVISLIDQIKTMELLKLNNLNFQWYNNGFSTDKELFINDEHPELEDGEIFLGNASKELFDISTWKTKRLGNIAYTPDGRIIKQDVFQRDVFPVFIQKKEKDYKWDIKNR